MKTLSVQQPWASMIVRGIKDIENRTWNTPFRGKILIHASSAKVSRNWVYDQPLEWFAAICNEQDFGSLPYDLKELPTSAIVGYVEVESVIVPGEPCDSLWQAGDDQYRWKLVNAYEFDEPVTDVKGKLHLFETPEISEENLPAAHQFDLNVPFIADDTLWARVSPAVFNDIDANHSFRIYASDYIGYILNMADDEGNLRKFSHAIFMCDGYMLGFNVDASGIYVVYDDKDEPVRWWSIYSSAPDHLDELMMLEVELGEPYEIDMDHIQELLEQNGGDAPGKE